MNDYEELRGGAQSVPNRWLSSPEAFYTARPPIPIWHDILGVGAPAAASMATHHWYYLLLIVIHGGRHLYVRLGASQGSRQLFAVVSNDQLELHLPDRHDQDYEDVVTIPWWSLHSVSRKKGSCMVLTLSDPPNKRFEVRLDDLAYEDRVRLSDLIDKGFKHIKEE